MLLLHIGLCVLVFSYYSLGCCLPFLFCYNVSMYGNVSIYLEVNTYVYIYGPYKREGSFG